MTTWDERFRSGAYPTDPDPSPVLRRYLDAAPDGRALDVATGEGRNAVFLASEGYRVDAIDHSEEGLRIAREKARERGVDARAEWIRADVGSFEFPPSTYDLVTISFYRAVDRFPDIFESLTPGGVAFVQHHLRTDDPVDGGPSGDRYRFAANELLHACLGLTVLHYLERTEVRNGKRNAVAEIVARNSAGRRQSYPEIAWE
ncbi:class I SAM-dependent methyltransferase [Halobellus ruber]|uniref:Class I SAM-dependent methyltransferase n=1 Tax=Halobellus ruber TaxID=2761102 RepID=A0A7J9SMN3_9EURY|nr:class I SAM-dependent methyltransferase [Halobellus ruber]MBB6647399.1 class I SAM-dependent methyltransferase [Halobellus ruber]